MLESALERYFAVKHAMERDFVEIADLSAVFGPIWLIPPGFGIPGVFWTFLSFMAMP